MDETYRGYRGLNQAEIDDLWNDGLLVLDTNVLLDFYRQTAPTRKSMLNALERSQKRLWMPHQVGMEFLLQRKDARRRATEAHNQVMKKIQDSVDETIHEVEGLAKLDARVSADDLVAAWRDAGSALKRHVKSAADQHGSLRGGPDDPVFEKVRSLFPDSQVGKAFSVHELSHHRRVGEERAWARQAPGFADFDRKEGDRRFGDYFLWVQTMEKAKESKRGVIFVTQDQKEDWRDREGHPLWTLLDEFYTVTGKLVQFYSPDEFIKEEATRAKASSAVIQAAKKAADEINAHQTATAASLQEALGPALAAFREISSTYASLLDSSPALLSILEHIQAAARLQNDAKLRLGQASLEGLKGVEESPLRKWAESREDPPDDIS